MNGDCNCLELCGSTLRAATLTEELINYDLSYGTSSKLAITRLKLVSYILVQLAPGTAKTAAEAISKIEGVKMAHAVTGPFDVIAFAEVPDLATLSELVLAKIQNVTGVQKTQTAVVVTPDIFRPSSPKTRKSIPHNPA